MGDDPDEPWIKWFGNQIIRAECQRFAMVGGGSLGACRGAGQCSDPFDTGKLHGVIDLGRAHIKRTSEDKGKTKDIVDLIGKIAPPCRHDCIRHNGAHGIGQNLGGGIGQCKDDWTGRHSQHQVRGQNARR